LRERSRRPLSAILALGRQDRLSFDLEGFRQGLASAGFVDGSNLTIEYLWAEGCDDRLPALAADLIEIDAAASVDIRRFRRKSNKYYGR
jgi:putative ABC transport system substrate-binding protein